MSEPFLLEGLQTEISKWLKTPDDKNGNPYSPYSKTAANYFLKETKKNAGENLFKIIFDGLEGRWNSRQRKKLPSEKNWQTGKNLEYDEGNPSAEVILEKLIAEKTSADWSNGLKTASGLFDDWGRKANIDLAKINSKANGISFIELKWASNNWLYAALELAGYAMAWLQARINSKDMGYFSTENKIRSALKFNSTKWMVLAPVNFFPELHSDEFRSVRDTFHNGIKNIFSEKLNDCSASFDFIPLPDCTGFEKSKKLPATFLKLLDSLVEG